MIHYLVIRNLNSMINQIVVVLVATNFLFTLFPYFNLLTNLLSLFPFHGGVFHFINC